MKYSRKITSWLLILAMFVGIFATVPAYAADSSGAETPLPLADLGGSEENDQKDAFIGWTNDALPQSTMKELINSQKLHPQRTGYVELDNRIDEILEPYADQDAYTKIQAIYEWAIKNVVYTHNGYGMVEGATNQYDYLTRTFYVEEMTYEEGLEHAIPDKVVNHASYALFEYKGACYDYASLMAVAIRHIGINAYVHTGYWILESDGSKYNHHGWTEIELDGKLYIIDPQREARYTQKMGANYNIYFGIPHENGADWRYWSPDTEANAERDALFKSVTDPRVDPGAPVGPGSDYDPNPDPGSDPDAETVTLQIKITGNGTVTCDAASTGDNTYQVKTGDKIHLEAVPGENSAFRGWWDKNKRDYLLATNPAFESAAQISADEGVTFFIDDSLVISNGVVLIEAVFENTSDLTIVSSRSGAVKSDGTEVAPVQEHLIGDQVNLTAEPEDGKSFTGWYDAEGKCLSTETEYSFTMPTTDTVIYALFEGDVFCDIAADVWYLDDVMEAVERGLVVGVTPVTFEGDRLYTRAMTVVMLARLEQADVDNAEPAPFVDVDADAWFAKSINWAYANGIITGRDETTFDPDASVTREEFFAMVVRYLNWKGYQVEGAELEYTDVDQITFAEDLIEQAQAMGLIQGDTNGALRPRDNLLRSEGATVMVRVARYMDATQP